MAWKDPEVIVYTPSPNDFVQGDLFGGAKGRAPRKVAWTELDRRRHAIRSLEGKIAATGGTEEDLLALEAAKEKLVSAEADARAKWKKCFKS